MKTYSELKAQLNLDESLTSTLFKLARLSADGRALKQAIKTGSITPIEKRIVRKIIGRRIGKLYRLV